ncbi:preprotein translocase subunit YajC [Microbacterium sediminis]|nr:preprotein translocase subunit YajC [Microbacterium sediminis]
MNLILLVVLAAMLVFMFINGRRNAKKRQELEQERRTKMVPGARVMTRSGLFGTLVEFDAEDLTQPAKVEIAPGVVAEMHAQAVDLAPEATPAAADETVQDDETTETADEGYSLNGERVEKLPSDDDTKN